MKKFFLIFLSSLFIGSIFAEATTNVDIGYAGEWYFFNPDDGDENIFTNGFALSIHTITDKGFVISVPTSLGFYENNYKSLNGQLVDINDMQGILYHLGVLFGFAPIKTENTFLLLAVGPGFSLNSKFKNNISGTQYNYGIQGELSFQKFFTEKVGLNVSTLLGGDFYSSSEYGFGNLKVREDKSIRTFYVQPKISLLFRLN